MNTYPKVYINKREVRIGPGSKGDWVFGSLLVIIGALFLFWSLYSACKSLKLLQTGLRTTAVVSEVKSRRSGEGSQSKINFTSPNGEKLVAQLNNRLSTGALVPIIYDPENPSFAFVDNRSDIWGPVILTALPGALFATAGFLLISFLLSSQRKWRELVEFGERITARVVEIIRARLGKRKKGYALLCRYIDPRSGRKYLFRSLPRHEPFGEDIIGSDITVLVKRGDFDIYYVDFNNEHATYQPKQ